MSTAGANILGTRTTGRSIRAPLCAWRSWWSGQAGTSRQGILPADGQDLSVIEVWPPGVPRGPPPGDAVLLSIETAAIPTWVAASASRADGDRDREADWRRGPGHRP